MTPVVTLADHRVSARHDAKRICGQPWMRPGDGYDGAIDPRALAVEHAVASIERETHRLDLGERIAVEAVLWQLVDDVAARKRDPW
jgi:hypothetical protein